MKKIAKLSLVAAMAVTAANAASLEEAIKNVDVSGKVYFETIANTNQAANGGTDTLSDIDVDITFKSKVNDNVTAVVRVEADKEDSESKKDFAEKQGVNVDNVYFSYVNGALTANIGKQDMNTPNTDGEVGNGALALYNAGFATLAGAYFYDHALENEGTTGNDIGVAAILGSIGPVNAEAWYVSYVGNHYTAVVSSKVGPVNLGARYAQSDLDANTEDGKTLKLTASANFGPFGLNAAYVNTDKDGAATVTDASSANTYELSQLGLVDDTAKTTDLEVADATIWAVGASYTMDAMKYQVDYADFESDLSTSGDITEADELRFRATYTMSKNFKIMGTYSIYEGSREDNTVVENDSARLEAKYSF